MSMDVNPMNNLSVQNPRSPESREHSTSRRDAVRSVGRLGLGLATASLPGLLAVLARSAQAQSTPPQQQPSVTEVLNFALTLEYLEAEYYTMGVNSGVVPAAALDIYKTIRDHEQAHVAFLQQALGGDAVAKPTFDFTAGGMFQPFSDYPTFLLLSQAFEDLGVRAYKGQAPNLLTNKDVLLAALSIHSVEARHAAEVRRLRGLQAWIPFDQPGVPPAVAPVYAGMAETTKYKIDVPRVSGVSAEAVTEAFDEALGMSEVLQIAGSFIKS